VRPLAIFAAAFVLMGCKSAPKQYTYSIYAAYLGVPAKTLELDGKPIVGKGDGHFDITLDAKDHITPMASRFAVVFTLSCGEEKLPVRKIEVGITHADDPSSEDYVRKTYVKPGESILGSIVIDPPRHAALYADLDGAAAPRIAVGTTVVTPSEKPAYVSLGFCPTAGDVSVDGAVVGKIEGKPIPENAKGDDANPPRSFLDVKGGHCYESVTHYYWEESSLGSPGAQASKPTIEPVGGARLYTREFDYFLTPAPSKLEGQADRLTKSRIELRRCAQRPALPTPPTKRKK
jgi:hypothetical protein